MGSWMVREVLSKDETFEHDDIQGSPGEQEPETGSELGRFMKSEPRKFSKPCSLQPGYLQ